MNIWNLFFKKLPKIKDDFFGEMLFMEIKDDLIKNYFECYRHFKPIDDSIEIGIDGNLSGSTQAQKNFFRQVENNYALIIEKTIPLIENRFQNWLPNFKIRNFAQEFKPVYLTIPNCEEKPICWEIAFETTHDLSYTLTIEMSDYKPQHVSVES